MSALFTPLPLRAEADFFTRSHRHAHRLFTCWYVFEGESTQATVVVGKKVSPLATARHNVKRRVREILRTTTAPTGLKAVFVMKVSALESRSAELREAINQVVTTLSHETPNTSRH